MKKILKKISFLLLPVFLVLFLDDIYCNYKLGKDSCYQIDSSIHVLILGHSHPQCAINDSLIPNTISMAQSSDSYFYVYYKYKKLIEANPQINVLVLGYTNNIFFEKMDDWIYKETYLAYKYPKYSQVISAADRFFLFRENPTTFIKSSLDAIKTKNRLVFSNPNRVYKSFNWGGYEYSTRSEVPRLLSEKKKNIDSTASLQTKTPEYNIIYFKKIIDYSQSHHIKVILLRTPLHRDYKREYEDQLMTMVKSYNKNVQFWDYSHFTLEDSDFIDLSHLNYKGAYKFSKKLNEDLFDNGYL